MINNEVDDSGIFPDLIIFEILTRLPAKTICRFKTVSKTWYSIISNPHFISSFKSRASQSWVIFNRFIRINPELGTEFSIKWRKPPNVSILSINPNKLALESSIYKLDSKYPATLVKSCNGVVLFSIKVKRDPWKEQRGKLLPWIDAEDGLFVINPITHDLVSIPKPPVILKRQCAIGFVTDIGINGVLKRFLVVEYQPNVGTKSAVLLLYSSEIGKWEEIPTNYILGKRDWEGDESFEFDGHLIWIDLRIGIIAWDEPFGGVDKVKCRFIALPKECVKPDKTPSLEDERCIDVGGGYIQYLEVFKGGDYGLNLWRLKEYERGEWSLVHKVSLLDIWLDDNYAAFRLAKELPNPSMMHPFEADIAFCMVGNRIFSLNLRTKKVEGCGSVNSNPCQYFYLAPVTLPSWPASFSPSLKATFQKERGNEYFNAKNFKEAINCYSRSIAQSPNVLSYANRALAYIKIRSYHKAEVDCTEALKLDGEYLKAYGRRATARKELGDLKGCIGDVELALKLKPNNPEMKKLYAEVKTLIKKASKSS